MFINKAKFTNSNIYFNIQSYFGVAEKGSSIQTEVIAGFSTFLALSYIFVVNPAILSQAGMDKSLVLFATIMASALATIAMGFWARLPFVLAPGMEFNSYVAYFVIGVLGLTWEEALGAVFWSGVICVILTISKLRNNIISAIPDNMKLSLSLSVACFLILIAFRISGVLIFKGISVQSIGNIISPSTFVLLVSLIIILIFEKLHIPGFVLISIILSSILCHSFGIGLSQEKSTNFSYTMFEGIGKFSLGVIIKPKVISVIITLFLIDFYGSIAKFIGLSMNTNLVKSGVLPKFKEALLVDSYATCLGSFLGSTNLITYIESGVGIGVGGRTGLTAIVCGILMILCFIVMPFLNFIPTIATTGTLIFVALKLCPSWSDLKKFTLVDIIMILIMQIMVVITSALDRAILAGFLVYLIRDLFSFRKPNIYIIISIILLFIGIMIQVKT